MNICHPEEKLPIAHNVTKPRTEKRSVLLTAQKKKQTKREENINGIYFQILFLNFQLRTWLRN